MIDIINVGKDGDEPAIPVASEAELSNAKIKEAVTEHNEDEDAHGGIPRDPEDIGAAPEEHAHVVSDVDGLSEAISDGLQDITETVNNLSDVASTGLYGDLIGKPSIPTQPTDINAAPEAHTHDASDVTGLADVATTGSYVDLSGAPTIPSTPGDIGADPAGTAQGLIDGLADVATSGSYGDLTDRPSVPSTPGDIGAAPIAHQHDASDITSGTLDDERLPTDLVREDDVRLSDARSPLLHMHDVGDVSGLAVVARTGVYGDLTGAPSIPSSAADVGAVPADGLPARIVGDGSTASVTGAGTPGDPLVITSSVEGSEGASLSWRSWPEGSHLPTVAVVGDMPTGDTPPTAPAGLARFVVASIETPLINGGDPVQLGTVDLDHAPMEAQVVATATWVEVDTMTTGDCLVVVQSTGEVMGVDLSGTLTDSDQVAVPLGGVTWLTLLGGH